MYYSTMNIKQITISEKYRIPFKPEVDSGLWIDRIGSGTDGKMRSTDNLRILGLFAAVGIKKGHGTFYSEETGEINIGENDVILLFPNIKHRYSPNDSWESKWIVWNGEEAIKLADMTYFSPLIPVIKNGYPAISHAYTRLEPLMNKENPTAIMERKVTLLNMLLELNKCSTTYNSYNAKTVKKAIDYIDMNLAFNFSLLDIAKHCGFSETHFRRIFKAETGVSPKEFIISRKISKAKEYLFANIPVKKIAFILGFKNEFYFRKVFKKVTGIPPGKLQ